jgi:hypothetical protein
MRPAAVDVMESSGLASAAMRAWQVGSIVVVLAASCGPHTGGSSDDDDHGADDAAATAGPDAFDGPWDDFPTAPIVDTDGGATTPPGAPGLFGDAGTGATTGGPCLIEPELGTLFPRNWLRPRFAWTATGGQNLFELRLTAADQRQPLIVYTTATHWTMPAAMWSGLRAHSVDQPITVTVRGAAWNGSQLTAGPARGSTGDIAIAPAEAPGAIVYWTTSGGSALRGFHVGDETVRDIVRPSSAGSGTLCIGCHSSTPDGAFVGFSASPRGDNGDPTRLGLRAADGTGGEPTFLSASARTLMDRQNQEQPAFSPMHWQAGDRVAVTMFPINNRFEITWTDLEATSTAQGTGWGILARGGDGGQAAYASFFHASDRLLYVSAATVTSGVTTTAGDLETVPFGGRAGGTATPVDGAATSASNEYYPTLSPDDRWIAYNRVPSGQSSYNDHAAEVMVIATTGGTPLRLAANDPPPCSGRTSPGVTNSWPKWAPAVTEVGGRRFYWLTFSSTRGAAGNPQLYVTPVVEENGALRSYPALYLWNQPATENNHTPAWDDFDIPIGRAR